MLLSFRSHSYSRVLACGPVCVSFVPFHHICAVPSHLCHSITRAFPGPMSELKAESQRPFFASEEWREAGGDTSADSAANVGVVFSR